MKYVFFFIMLLCVAVPANSQVGKSKWDEYYREHPEKTPKNWKFTDQGQAYAEPDAVDDQYVKNAKATRDVGTAFIAAGLAAFSAGATIHLVNVNGDYKWSDQEKLSQNLMPIGTLVSIVGVIMNYSGQIRLVKYKISTVKMQSYIAPGSAGLTLSYRF